MIEFPRAGATQELKMNQMCTRKNQILQYNNRTRSFQF